MRIEQKTHDPSVIAKLLGKRGVLARKAQTPEESAVLNCAAQVLDPALVCNLGWAVIVFGLLLVHTAPAFEQLHPKPVQVTSITQTAALRPEDLQVMRELSQLLQQARSAHGPQVGVFQRMQRYIAASLK